MWAVALSRSAIYRGRAEPIRNLPLMRRIEALSLDRTQPSQSGATPFPPVSGIAVSMTTNAARATAAKVRKAAL
jgi:hypothetical protein